MAVCLVLVFSSSVRSAGLYEKYLSIADVEKETGIKGIQYSPKNPAKLMGGDLNFFTGKSSMVVTVEFRKFNYPGFKENYYKADIKDIGDEAFEGRLPASKANDIVIFRKGDMSVVVKSGLDWGNDMKPKLTMDKLIAIARIIASRM